MKIKNGDCYRYKNKLVFQVISDIVKPWGLFGESDYEYKIIKDCSKNELPLYSPIYCIKSFEHSYGGVMIISKKTLKCAIKDCEKISEREALAWSI